MELTYKMKIGILKKWLEMMREDSKVYKKLCPFVSLDLHSKLGKCTTCENILGMFLQMSSNCPLSIFDIDELRKNMIRAVEKYEVENGVIKDYNWFKTEKTEIGYKIVPTEFFFKDNA